MKKLNSVILRHDKFCRRWLPGAGNEILKGAGESTGRTKAEPEQVHQHPPRTAEGVQIHFASAVARGLRSFSLPLGAGRPQASALFIVAAPL